MKRAFKPIHAGLVTIFMLVVLSMVAFAQEVGEVTTPIVELLEQPIVLFGLGGGMIVTVTLSVLKAFNVVGKDSKIPTLLANFLISVIVVAGSSILSGQDVATAIIAALTSLLSAIGIHETAGHGLARLAGNR